MTNDSVILFDGVCNLCNNFVQFVIKHDKNERFKFASLQSDYAQKRLKSENLPQNDMRSIILIENNQIYRQSTAVLKIAKHLSGGWKLFQIFLILPKFIRNPIYSYIAKHRYKWFGKKDECMIPTPNLKSRFLEA